MRDEDIVGATLAEVLPKTSKYWFQQSHLLRLNLILLVPLLSSAVAGYDGKGTPQDCPSLTRAPSAEHGLQVL